MHAYGVLPSHTSHPSLSLGRRKERPLASLRAFGRGAVLPQPSAVLGRLLDPHMLRTVRSLPRGPQLTTGTVWFAHCGRQHNIAASAVAAAADRAQGSRR